MDELKVMLENLLKYDGSDDISQIDLEIIRLSQRLETWEEIINKINQKYSIRVNSHYSDIAGSLLSSSLALAGVAKGDLGITNLSEKLEYFNWGLMPERVLAQYHFMLISDPTHFLDQVIPDESKIVGAATEGEFCQTLLNYEFKGSMSAYRAMELVTKKKTYFDCPVTDHLIWVLSKK